MPAEVIEQSRLRLYWLAGSAVVATISFALLARFLQPEVAAAQQLTVVQVTIALVVVLSLALIFLLRSQRMSAVTSLRIGLFYGVFFAGAIAVLENSMEWRGDTVIRGTSSIMIWLIAYALLVPAPPVTATLFGLAAASMGPLVHIFLSPLMGLPHAPWTRVLIYYLPCFLMAIAAGLVDRKILRLEHDVARARDLGSYELESRIAAGGMGEVWKARHRLLKRDAAVKVIRPEFLVDKPGRQAEVLRRRFEQEARSTAALRSPHTVALYDFGSTADGSFYYAMELLEGVDLEKLVKLDGPQQPGRVVHILRQACDSLEEAHRRGMIHRDIKPTNLYLCQLGVIFDFIKLLDFGLVKRLTAEEGVLQTVGGTTTGTPAFMAPEIALGIAEIDGRADIYGLGCVAYWLLTGRLVFEEPNATAVIVAHVQKEPEPPSQRTELPIPPELDRIVLACLAKKPEDRPASAAALSRMLTACSGIIPWDNDQAEEWWRLHLPDPTAPGPSETPTKTGVSLP